MRCSIIQHNLPDCPIETALLIIGNRWKCLIGRELLTGSKRYSELKQAIPGISEKMLAQSLKSLAADGLVLRTVYPEVPTKVVYTLTPLGHSLKPVLQVLRQWGLSYQAYSKEVLSDEY